MPSLPLPFFTSFFFFFILLKLTFSNGTKISVLPLLAIGSYGLQSAFLGMVWGYQITFSLPFMAAFATLIPPLTYAALISMVTKITNLRVAWLLGPAFGLALFILFIPWIQLRVLDNMLDFIIVSVYLFYGGLMIWTALSMETEWMDQLPFQKLISANRTFIIAGTAMLLSALTDMIIFYSLASGRENISLEVVSLSNLMLLVALGISVLRMSNAAPDTVFISGIPASAPSACKEFGIGMTHEELVAMQTKTLTQLDKYMLERRIYRDENLSLDRLARRTLIPSRQISSTINNLHALNVPQYVNTFRIIEACERLKKTGAPVTEIIYAVGFTTKSNFNREFKRIVGVSPSAWRHSNDFGTCPSDWPFVMDFTRLTVGLWKNFTLQSAEELT